VSVPACLGCTVKHVTTARVELGEAVDFYKRGDRRMGDIHLLSVLGELRSAEKQSRPWPEISQPITAIRKQVEADMASGKPPSDGKAERLSETALKALEMIRREPSLCPTCLNSVGKKVVHEATHG